MPTYSQFFKNSVENLRSGIVKNTLMLVNEFLKHFLNQDISSAKSAITSLVSVVMPSILNKTVAKEGFINKMATNVMKNCVAVTQ